MSQRALEDVLTWYRTARKLLGGIQKRLARDPDALLSLIWPEEWRLQPVDQVRHHLEKTVRELDDYTVVALFGVFEGWLEEDSKKRGFKADTAGRLLPLYNPVVPKPVAKEIARVKMYRDWVAHGRRWRKPPDVEPSLAHEHLSGFVQCAEMVQEER
jgi:hypothetical protein